MLGMRGHLLLLQVLGLLLAGCAQLNAFLLPPEARPLPPCQRTPEEAPLPLSLPEGRLVLEGGRLYAKEDGAVRPVGELRRVPFRLLGFPAPNDPLYPAQAPFFQAADFPWDSLPELSCAPTVAVIDSAFNPDHPDLAGRVAWAGETVGDGLGATGGGGWTGDAGDHGTGVAGILGALTHNRLGIASLSAGRARLLLYRVMSPSPEGGWDAARAIAEAVLDAVDRGANVINLSLGAREDPGLRPVFAYARSKGVVVVAAAGNDGGELLYPARYPEVVAVGSAEIWGELAPYSSRPVEPHPTFVSAPVGSSGLPSLSFAGYRTWAGTSFAAPQVAGVAALHLASRPGGVPAPSGVEACLRQASSGPAHFLDWRTLLNCP